MSNSTVPTTILLISDTHAHPLPSPEDERPYRLPLPNADILIHSGDLTQSGLQREYEITFNDLASHPAPLKLVIAGNHDLTLDKDYLSAHPIPDQTWPWYKLDETNGASAVPPTVDEAHAAARDLWTGPAAKAANILYLEEGTHEINLGNGARLRVFASPYTPAFCDMAFPYHRHQDRWSPAADRLAGTESIVQSPIQPDTDIVMTHGPPMWIMDGVQAGKKTMNTGCRALTHALARVRPLLHVFGHIHEGWGIERVQWSENEHRDPEKALQQARIMRAKPDLQEAREDRAVEIDATDLETGKETLFVNAAIMDVSYRPVNAPVLVTLDLPRSKEAAKW